MARAAFNTKLKAEKTHKTQTGNIDYTLLKRANTTILTCHMHIINKQVHITKFFSYFHLEHNQWFNTRQRNIYILKYEITHIETYVKSNSYYNPIFITWSSNIQTTNLNYYLFGSIISNKTQHFSLTFL